MINENNLVNNISEDFPDHYNFDSKIIRLQSTLFARIKLVNMFKRLIDKNYIPLTLKNININIEDDRDIERFMIRNTNWVESVLDNQVKDWVINNGSDFQKNRI
jgi:hypothetical protein